MDVFIHTPDLAEIGSFWGARTDSTAALAALEKKAATEFLFAATANQPEADKLLEAAKWTSLGYRYNQFHGPNFIRLWFKHQPEFAGKAATPAGRAPAWNRDGGATPGYYCNFGCGLWYANRLKERIAPEHLNTKWCTLFQTPPKASLFLPDELPWWKRIAVGAMSSLWTNVLTLEDASLKKNGGPGYTQTPR